MLRSLLYALPGTLFIFLMTTLGAAMVFVLSGKPRPYAQRTTLGFAAGVMTAACVWSLLLPAMEQVRGLPVWLPAAGGLLLGAGFLAGLDTWLSDKYPESEEGRTDRLLMLAITLHNVPEGMAVGLPALTQESGSRGLSE